ncbi:MAG: hypothetical protein NC395_01520 [Prevotella sp.]|nr:hypothetical protein [Prevotella sp.]
MKLKKILAAIAACAMTAAVLTMSVAAAGAEVDDSTLDDGDEEIVAEDEDEGEDEAPADDEDEDETPAAPVDETPAAPVQNPPTGNSPIALAVIPVALAAAAVVAKKAK